MRGTLLQILRCAPNVGVLDYAVGGRSGRTRRELPNAPRAP